MLEIEKSKRTTFAYSKLSAHYPDVQDVKGGRMVQQSPGTHYQSI